MDSNGENGNADPPKRCRTLWEHFGDALRRREKPPLSFYLPLAILVVVLLGTQLYFVRDDPKRFAFVLVSLFLFFVLMIFIALLDVLQLWRKALRDRERVYRETLGDEDFVRRVREGIDRQRKDS
jgi:hypothetical protein